MGKPVKVRMMKEVASELSGVDGVVSVNYRGLSAEKLRGFRLDLSDKNLRFLVVRNSLTRRALAETQLAGIESVFDGPTGLVYGHETGVGVAIAAARAVMDWNKGEKDEAQQFVPTGALNEGEVIPASGVAALSKLPDRDTMRGMVAIAVHGTASGIARCLNGVAGGIARCLQQRIEQGEEAGEVAE